MRYLIVIYLFICLALTSCSYKQDQVLLQQKGTILDTGVVKTYANISNYRIKPQDILQITNVQANKSLVDITAGVINNTSPGLLPSSQADNYTVEEDGTVALTGLGRVKVSGLTRMEARNYIESLYKKDILKEPLFDLKIINLKVTLLGEVKGPGQIILTHDNTTLIEILALAGGLTEKADNRTIKVVRGGQNVIKTDIIDISDAKILNDPKIVVQNNDIVVVSQNKRALRSEKLLDFSTTVSPFLLVFNTALIIITLISR